MDFDKAIQAHAGWKIKLSKYIKKPDGSLKSMDIYPDNKCELGKWLHENEKDLKDNKSFLELKKCHQNFHRCAADIVTRADKGEKLSDVVALGSKSEYATLSGNITKHLMEMRRSIN